MADSYTFYRLFYFFLFAYATYTCLSACIRGSRDAANSENNNDNNNNNTEGKTQKQRRDLVRDKLEFRKILASSSPGRGAELGPPIDPDLEKGEGDPSSSSSQVPISQGSLVQLADMGFTLNASRKALSAVGGSDTEAAMDWIFNHNDDPELNDPIEREPPTMTPYVERQDDSDSKISSTVVDNRDNTGGSVRSFLTSSMHFLSKVSLNGLDSKNSSSNNNEQECCSICLEAYKVGDTVARLKRTPEQVAREKRCESIAEAEHEHEGECNHWFHEDCILEWLQNHDECPLCRTNMIHGSA
eukprot:CAMPEP_0116134060 /NCGR_PEP_ID=MMETSP0329-20121206/10447_1 /TAXON_ID=697910 /ORGANISM="Pseudo-nitzschia arenysensis, Strain B593" /LENGTH=299 /DNA_ID=CAMNT_0003628751 /DNA_START=16 /DNA_END=915 /DNA_ORIENTATION=-